MLQVALALYLKAINTLKQLQWVRPKVHLMLYSDSVGVSA